MTSVSRTLMSPQYLGGNQKRITNQANVNFKAGEDQFVRQIPSEEDMKRMIEERQKSQKQAKKKQKWLGVLQVGALISSIALAGFFIWQGIKNGRLSKGDAKLSICDVSKEKGFEDLVLPKELQEVVDDLKIKINRATHLKEKGLAGNNGIILYGKPGGGKNTFVYALTKEFQKTHPGSELVMVDVNKFKGMYNGQTENSILNFIEQLKKKAAENPNRKLVVFLDEFDSIASKADGPNSKSMESFQNAFKTTLGEIMKIDNVQLIAATNKAEKGKRIEELLDSAISNRFAEKIHIPLPTKEQMADSFSKHFSKIPEKYVDKKLLDVYKTKGDKTLTEFWDKICDYITNESHDASYRDFNTILGHAKTLSEVPSRKAGSPITKQDLVDAVLKHSKNSNWDEKLTEQFKAEITQLLEKG